MYRMFECTIYYNHNNISICNNKIGSKFIDQCIFKELCQQSIDGWMRKTNTALRLYDDQSDSCNPLDKQMSTNFFLFKTLLLM